MERQEKQNKRIRTKTKGSDAKNNKKEEGHDRTNYCHSAVWFFMFFTVLQSCAPGSTSRRRKTQKSTQQQQHIHEQQSPTKTNITQQQKTKGNEHENNNTNTSTHTNKHPPTATAKGCTCSEINGMACLEPVLNRDGAGKDTWII